ncbi:Uncharacterised protein [Mycobacteroides abscessus subsp. massiliense]|uniref:Uncharacterized protein n=1 Tax=Mycobacteroides abscessus subsp. massiliense TaxID=1962118 RepID=A0A1T8VCB9_9MYCO|nr:Uncharacterised protein [Mycobacteroides abscessus subsp. massiliense]
MPGVVDDKAGPGQGRVKFTVERWLARFQVRRARWLSLTPFEIHVRHRAEGAQWVRCAEGLTIRAAKRWLDRNAKYMEAQNMWAQESTDGAAGLLAPYAVMSMRLPVPLQLRPQPGP